MRPPKYDLTTDNPAGGVVPRFNPSAALGTPPPVTPAFVHPFQLHPDPDSPGDLIFTTDSFLFGALDTSGGSITITGLGSSWTVAANDFVYLHCEISSGTITSVEILVDATDFDNVVFGGGGDQTDFYLKIGFAEAIPVTTSNITGFRIDADTWFYQRVFTNLRITNFCVDGSEVLFPIST